MTNSINSQCRRKFLSKSGTCFKVVCVEMPICPRPRCASVSAGIRNECSGLAALSLTDSERAACPQYQNKSSISCFVNLRCCLPCGGDCQVTFRKLSLYLSVCHAKPSPPPPPNPTFPPCLLPFLRRFPPLPRNKFIVIRNAVPRLNGFCLKWDLREWAWERKTENLEPTSVLMNKRWRH